MAGGVQTLRAATRWPTPDERFAAGWTWLGAARPLLDVLADESSAGTARADAALWETLRRLQAALDADAAALLVTEPLADATRGTLVLRRLLVGEEAPSEPPPLRVAFDVPVVPELADAVASLVVARWATEVPLTVPGADRPVGWLVAVGATPPGDLDEWATVVEDVAWVFALGLRRGWDAWRAGGGPGAAWPGLSGPERALCAAALARAQRDERSLAERSDVTGSVRRIRAERRSDPDAWPSSADAAPRPRTVDENVQFTVYRPRRIPPETWCPVLAFAHLAERRADAPAETRDPVEEVRRQAEQVLGDLAGYADTTQDATEGIPREGEVTFVLDLPDLQVNPRQRSFRWLEDVQREEFRVKAAAALDGRTVRGALCVYLGALLVAEVTLAIRVDGATTRAGEADVDADHARPYRRIFPSYSHLDEAIVRQVEAYARTLGDEYLRDATHLRSGEVWTERLAEFIRTADVFQLFWSRNSMLSPWVRREWEYALSLRRPYFVRPTYWETPLPEAPERDLPPPALRALHFQRLAMASDAPTPRKPERRHGPAGAAPPMASPVPPSQPATTVSAPAPRPRARRRWRPPAAIAALLLVGMIGGSVFLHRASAPIDIAVPPPPPPPPMNARLPAIQFAEGDATVRVEGRDALEKIVEELNAHPHVRVVIEGHDEKAGSPAESQRLSERRARTVKDALIAAGVDATRITTQGYGESRPVADNATAAGRAANRRVEVVVE